MAVIFALFLILWAWGRFEMFALRTGHGNGPKIDFLFNAYFGVDGYPWMIENVETLFRRRCNRVGLHKTYYQPQCKSQINKGFYC